MSALGRRAARAAPESSTLKLEDREAKGGRGRAAAEAGNVVRLPREWLGPPEELIPFGPTAGATAEERSEPVREEAAGPFPDFWGEESAVLQDVIEAQAEPDVVQTPEAVEGSSRAHAASPIGAEENASTQLPADHPPPQPAARQHAKPGPRWQASLTTTRRTRIVAVAALLFFAIAGTVVLASHGPRPAARISAWSSSADSFGRSLPKAVAAAQARLTRAETNLTRATRHLAAQHRRAVHLQGAATPTPPTPAESGPATSGNGISQPVGGGSSPPSTQYTPAAEPAQQTYTPAQHSAPAPEPPRASPSGALTCISNCG